MPRQRASGEWEFKRRPGRDGWHAYRNRDKRPQWVSLGTESEAEGRQAFEDLKAGAFRRAVPTVGQMLETYLEDRKGRVTAYKRLQEAAKPLKAGLGYLRPDQVTARQWAGYCAQRAVSAGTLRRERNVLVAAFNLAGLKAKIPSPPMPPPRSRYLTREEADRLLGAFVSPHARLLYTILLYTGARKGQAIGLTWDRVDFAHNRIDFNEPGRVETVKRRAVVPMGPKLRAAMEEAYRCRTTDFVIEWEGAQASRVRWPWRRARERAKLGPEVTPHTLRHTAASWLAMARVPIDEAADLLACDPVTLRRVYRHFDPSHLLRAVTALEG